MQELFDKIFVVSLKSSHDRRAHVIRHLPEHFFYNFEFFDATEKSDPIVAESATEVVQYPPCFRCGLVDCGKPDCNNYLMPAQIATYITYRRLWSRIADGDEGRILVVEDDVYFHDHCQRVLNFLVERVRSEEVPFKHDFNCLLRLGWARCVDHELELQNMYVDSAAVRMSNPCHALTRQFARSLIERDSRINHTVDVFQHKIAPREHESYTIFPPIASELSWSEGKFDSLIHPKSVRVDFLNSIGDEAEAKMALKALSLHVKKKHFRPILITGHPRCGTGYAAGLCRQLGLDVGHEKVGKDGISSWMFAVEAELNPYALDDIARSRKAFAWKYLVMPVRNIAEAAASVIRDSEHAPPSYKFRRDHILAAFGLDLDDFESPLARAVLSVTSWSRIVCAQNPDLVFRIEDEHEALRGFLISNKIIDSEFASASLDPSPVNQNKSYKGVKYEKQHITPADWASLSAKVKAEVNWYCQRFGYDSPIPPDASNIKKLFLDPSGWSRSKSAQAPVTEDGSPLPWFTYAAIEFLSQVVRPTDHIFEYGAGFSTLWWQTQAKFVTSVEHDSEWIARISHKLAENVTLEHRPIDAECTTPHPPSVDDFFRKNRNLNWEYDQEKVVRRGLEDARFISYANFISESCQYGSKFDFIIIDGMARRLCTYIAVEYLNSDGFLVLDNSNRSDYDLAYEILDQYGFRQIPFWGLVPGADFYTCTSIFTRSINRLPSGQFSGTLLKLPEY